MKYRALLSVLAASSALAGCSIFDPPPQPPPHAQAVHRAPAAPKQPETHLACTFGEGAQYRNYAVTGDAVIDTTARPHLRLTVVSDDGETITAAHMEHGAEKPPQLTVNLRQHDATLTTADPRDGTMATLQGTCAETG